MGRICGTPFFFSLALSLGQPSISGGGGAAVGTSLAGASVGRETGTDADCCDSGAETRCAWVKTPSAGTGRSITADEQPGPVHGVWLTGRRGGSWLVGFRNSPPRIPRLGCWAG